MFDPILRLFTTPGLLQVQLERLGRRAVLYLLAGLLGLLALGYLLLSLHEALLLVLPPALAALVIALLAALASLALILAAKRPPRPLLPPPVQPLVRPVVPPVRPPVDASLPLTLLETAARTDRLTGLALALLAGVVAVRGKGRRG